MSRLAKEHKVLYVEPGLHSLRTWPGWLWRRVAGQTKQGWRIQHRDGNLWTCTADLYVPLLGRCAAVRRAVRAFDRFWLRKILARLGMRDPVLWIYLPEGVDYCGTLGERLVCYDCVDFHAANAESEEHRLRIETAEYRLMQRADVVFATSPGLYESKREENQNTHLVHNVADVAHFGKSCQESTEIPADVADLPKPVVGFWGAVSAYKVDTDLLGRLARQRPEYSIVLIGPVGHGDPSTDVSELRSLPNVHIIGTRSYGELPGYAKAFDVLLIPYRDNDYTRGCFPLKMFEYLATGKPIVVTGLSSVSDYRELFYLAEDSDDFLAKVDAAVAEHDPALCQRRMSVASANTWESRVAKMTALVEEELATRGRKAWRL